MLRPLDVAGLRGWRDVRLAQRGLAAAVGAAAPAGAGRPGPRPQRVRRRCAARDRERSADHAYPFGVFVDEQLAGEVNLNNVTRGALQGATIGYWIDRERAGQAYIAEAVVVVDAVRLRAAAVAPARDLHRPAQHQQPARRREARHSRCEGLAERFLEINGVWEDHLRFAITTEEWSDARRRI